MKLTAWLFGQIVDGYSLVFSYRALLLLLMFDDLSVYFCVICYLDQ